MKVDVIILSNTVDGNIWAMTQNAIDSLRNSDPNVEYNVILVETNSNIEHKYFGVNVIEFPGETFNYNRFLNIGFRHLSDADYVIIANNDLRFEPGWFKTIQKAMNEHNLDSASPRSPGWFTQVGMDSGLFPGYDVGQKFCGWLLVYRRESLDAIRPLDEQFEFFCQDNDMAMSSATLGQKHALVADSVVHHLANQSHRTVKDMNRFTNVMVERFHKKWG